MTQVALETYYHLVRKSANRKLGGLAASTAGDDTCPDTCPLKGKGKGCYGNSGPQFLHWRLISQRKRGVPFSLFTKQVRALPDNEPWRHDTTGDLPGKNNRLHIRQFKMLVRANRGSKKQIGKKGFTFTHKPLFRQSERDAIRWANTVGFTVNLSANSPADADRLVNLGIGPVVMTFPLGSQMPGYTPQGHKLTQCPAQTANLDCKRCGLCWKAFRKTIIAFEAHGSQASAVQ